MAVRNLTMISYIPVYIHEPTSSILTLWTSRRLPGETCETSWQSRWERPQWEGRGDGGLANLRHIHRCSGPVTGSSSPVSRASGSDKRDGTMRMTSGAHDILIYFLNFKVPESSFSNLARSTGEGRIERKTFRKLEQTTEKNPLWKNKALWEMCWKII